MDKHNKRLKLRGALLAAALWLFGATHKTFAEEDKGGKTLQSFFGTVCYFNYVSRGLDFIVMTQERPGQNYPVDNINHQFFEFIRVHRPFNPADLIAIDEIRRILIQGYESGGIRVIVFGQYSTELALTKGRSDGYLIVESLHIFVPEGRYHIGKTYHLNPFLTGVVRGIFGGTGGCTKPSTKR